MQNIFIFGYKGQDGFLLKTKLEKSGLDIKFFLLAKNSLKIVYKNSVVRELKFVDQLDYLNIVSKLISENKPDIISYLAAVPPSSPENEADTNSQQLLFTNYALTSFILNKCLILGFKPKFIYASSSLVFSGSMTSPQNELTLREPQCNYSKQKVLSEDLLLQIGDKYNIPVLVPIFYNHESVLRKEKFFSKKVISFCSEFTKDTSSKKLKTITLFNPDSVIDMGYAPEYIDILLELVYSNKVGSFIFSSGNPTTVKEFVENVTEFYGISQDIINFSCMKSRFKANLIGDNKKLLSAIGRKPLIHSKKLAQKLCNDYEAYVNK